MMLCLLDTTEHLNNLQNKYPKGCKTTSNDCFPLKSTQPQECLSLYLIAIHIKIAILTNCKLDRPATIKITSKESKFFSFFLH